MEESSQASEKQEELALRDAAFRLLTRREHSQFELTQKLLQKGWPKAQVTALLSDLAEQGWQSDVRFAGSFVRDKLMQGQGRLKIIAQATQQRGLERSLVEAALEEEAVDWIALCREVHQRKFGEQAPADRKQWAKRVRYLQQRGFSSDEIFTVIGELDS